MKGLTVLATLALLGSAMAQNQVWVYSLSNLLDRQVIRSFEQQTGIDVRVSTYDSTEEFLTKIGTGGGLDQYNLLLVPDYTVTNMVRNKQLLALDKSKLSNFKNLDSRYLNLPYDNGNRFTAPLLLSMVGLMYRTDVIPTAPTSWGAVLSNPSRRFTLLDSPREMLGVALRSQSKSASNSDVKGLQSIAEALQRTRASSNSLGLWPSRLAAEEIAAGRASLGVVYSHDALKSSGRVAFTVPREGSVQVLFNLAIPAKTKDPAAALRLINYLLDAKNNAALAEASKTATPNRAARALVSAASLNNPNIWPSSAVAQRLEFMRDQGNSEVNFRNAWIIARQ